MKPDRPLILSILFLAEGLTLIFGYADGTTGLSAAWPVASSTLHINVNTTGPPALGGIALLAIGVLLLLWSLLAAVVNQLMLLCGASLETRQRRSYSILANDEDDVSVARLSSRSSFLGLESAPPLGHRKHDEATTTSTGIDGGGARATTH